MKRISYYALFTAIVLFTSCAGDSSKKETKDEPAASDKPAATTTALSALDLSSTNINAVINAPVGASAKANSFNVTINGGEGFAITIDSYTESLPTLAELKNEIEKNEINKLKKYIKDDPMGFVYESEVMDRDEFHFNYLAKIGDTTYLLSDTRGAAIYSEDQAKAMFEAAKSFKSK